MTTRHWMHVVALASAMGFAGTAAAIDTNATTGADDRSGTSSSAMETPSAGAIVTPEDRAMGLGKDNGQARDRIGDVDNHASTLKDETSNDEELSVNPGSSNDEELSVNPGSSNDEESSVNPGS